MPECLVCQEDTPITHFVLLSQAMGAEVTHWSFCCYDHMKEWVLTYDFCSMCQQIKPDEEMYEGILCFTCKEKEDRRDMAEEIRRMRK